MPDLWDGFCRRQAPEEASQHVGPAQLQGGARAHGPGGTATCSRVGMTEEKDAAVQTYIVIEAQADYDPTYFTISVPQQELHARLKQGDSLEDIAEELMWDSDYAESESDPYYSNFKLNRVTVEPASR
jgi:hypothetical protein